MVREDVAAAFAAWDAARAALAALPYDALSAPELLAVYERRQHAHRRDAALDHTVLATLAHHAAPEDFGRTSLRDVLAERLHLNTADINKRLDDAAQLGARWSFLGGPLVAALERTAAALAAGAIGMAHVREIQRCLTKLPGWVDTATRDSVEHDLAALATGMRPEDLRKAADHLLEVIDPDGDEPDHDDQQAKRGIRVGRQQRDGMTPISGLIDPETRALFDVVRAKWAAPGESLPTDPGLAETLRNDIAGGDARTPDQRDHDALKTALTHLVQSGQLGQLNGLPATVVVTTTLKDLETAAGYAHTAGGTKLPIRDVIRLAGHSQHYLAVFDDHTEEVLYLGRAKRCATTAQRLALYARDKGCTRPGCTRPPIHCQVHHAQQPWATGGQTNIDELTLACQPDNNLIEHTDWTTRRHNGRTEWIPPPTLDTGQTRINHYHHPHRYLTERNDDAEPA